MLRRTADAAPQGRSSETSIEKRRADPVGKARRAPPGLPVEETAENGLLFFQRADKINASAVGAENNAGNAGSAREIMAAEGDRQKNGAIHEHLLGGLAGGKLFRSAGVALSLIHI